MTLFSPFMEGIGDPSWPCCKIGQDQPRVIIYISFLELESLMLHAKFQDHRTSGSGEEDFYYIWWLSWSCDLDHLYRLSFPLTKEAPNEIWHWLAERFQRRCLKMLVIYMYIARGQGQTSPGVIFSLSVSANIVLCCTFSPIKWLCYSFPHSNV